MGRAGHQEIPVAVGNEDFHCDALFPHPITGYPQLTHTDSQADWQPVHP